MKQMKEDIENRFQQILSIPINVSIKTRFIVGYCNFTVYNL
ncbi:hypothetical protein BH23THE1_BH23THE1_26210 [soil metagenome]